MTKSNAELLSERVVESLSSDGETFDPRMALEALLLATAAIISETTANPVKAAGWYAQALVMYVDPCAEAVQ